MLGAFKNRTRALMVRLRDRARAFFFRRRIRVPNDPENPAPENNLENEAPFPPSTDEQVDDLIVQEMDAVPPQDAVQGEDNDNQIQGGDEHHHDQVQSNDDLMVQQDVAVLPQDAVQDNDQRNDVRVDVAVIPPHPNPPDNVQIDLQVNNEGVVFYLLTDEEYAEFEVLLRPFLKRKMVLKEKVKKLVEKLKYKTYVLFLSVLSGTVLLFFRLIDAATAAANTDTAATPAANTDTAVKRMSLKELVYWFDGCIFATTFLFLVPLTYTILIERKDNTIEEENIRLNVDHLVGQLKVFNGLVDAPMSEEQKLRDLECQIRYWQSKGTRELRFIWCIRIRH